MAKLLDAPIVSLIPKSHPKIVCVNSTDSLAHTLQVLVKHQIHSVPVYDPSKQKFVAFVDLIDFAVHLSRTYIENEIIEGSVDRMLQEEKHYQIVQIANESTRNPWVTVQEGATLRQVLEIIVQRDIHRVAVLNDKQELTYVLTQSDIVQFLHQHNRTAEFESKSLHQLGIGLKEVITVSQEEKVWKAFVLMDNKRVSGVGVADSQGHLVGHIGAADLKGIDFNTHIMEKLRLSVKDFKQLSIVAVPPSASFKQVLDTLAETKMHRVYLTDTNNATAKGVVSQIDIIQAVYSTFK